MHAEESRLHYMDNLRAIIMTLGVFLHAALACGPALDNLEWSSAYLTHEVICPGVFQ